MICRGEGGGVNGYRGSLTGGKISKRRVSLNKTD